jgi:rSAM/selenodomain-associated transferase 1
MTAAVGQRPALIIFAKKPVPGTVKTRLVPPLTPENAAGLYACMLQDTLAMVATLSGVTPFLFFQDDPGAAGYFAAVSPDIVALPQQGDCLGERMRLAFREIFQRGFHEVVIIGSDSPDLPADYVRDAFALLGREPVDLVFGPSTDGGYYLLATRRVQDELFRDIPWSTGAVLETSIARARSAGLEVVMLPVWYDLDTPADLDRPGLRAADCPAARTAGFLRQTLPLP